MALFSGKMMASGAGGNFYTLLEAKRANLNDASYRKPSGMFDVATSSSGEVYALNGERNALTGLYNAVLVKFGSIGGVSWQFTISAAKNVYPCALGCYEGDNSVYVCVVETTDLNGANNFNGKRTDDTTAAWQDSTGDAVYHFVKFSASGSRIWENTYESSNASSYPAAINKVQQGGGGAHTHSNVFLNRSVDNVARNSLMGAPDLQLVKTVGYDGRSHSDEDGLCHDINERNVGAQSFATAGVTTQDQRAQDVYSLDGPHFGGRPQCTSNILIDAANLQFYILVAANASATDLSLSKSTMHILKIPFTGITVSGRELVYPGGWQQNTKITLDKDGKLLIPWSSTTVERRIFDTAGSTGTYAGNSNYYKFCDTGHSNNLDTENTGAYLRYDFATMDFDLHQYGGAALVGPPKVCNIQKEESAGVTYEYVTTAGLNPPSNVTLGELTSGRNNDSYHRNTGRYTNFVQLHKANIATGSMEWVRTFFPIPNGLIRDQNNDHQNGTLTGNWRTVGTPEISVADSRVFSNGIYYVGNVVFQTEALDNSSPYLNKNSYVGFVAKINFDGTVDYIREVRSLVDNISEYESVNSNEFPPYYYQSEQNGGVLLDSINFDAFNNMIITARHISDSNVGSSGLFVDNLIMKLPHNGDLIGQIEVRDTIPPNGTGNTRLRRFTYTPATVVRCWEEVLYDNNIQYSARLETYKLLRCCTLWNTNGSSTKHNPSSVGQQVITTGYQSATGINPVRLVSLDTGTYNGRFLWQTPTTNLQLDVTQNRAWDRAERRSSSSIFLQTLEESGASTVIEPKASCPAWLYVDQVANTDNAQTDFDAATYGKLIGDTGVPSEARIKKQEHPNGLITVSQYYDGTTIRKQLLTRHGPTGGVETRMYDTGFNTYPKDVCIDEVGNIYAVGWTADTSNSNNYGVGYITCYNKDLAFQWAYRYVNNDNTTLVDGADNAQIHCCAVTLDASNTAKLFVGGHYTSVNSSIPTQHATVNCIPLSIAGSGAPTVPSTTIASTAVELGAAVSNNQIDGIFGIDVMQTDTNDSSKLFVGYAGALYDTTGTTTRGMYGIVEYSGSTPSITTGSDSSGYVIGDDLALNTFRFQNAVASVQGTTNSNWGYQFAVGGQETQSSKTNGVVLVCNTEQDGSTNYSNYVNHPWSVTSFVINNSQGADIVKDLRYGYVEQPGVDKGATGVSDYTTVSTNNIGSDNSFRFREKKCYNDRLFVLASITNQFSQIDTYIAEITSANLTVPNADGGNSYFENKTPDAANVTRVGKLSTSGITEPSGLVINGPEYGTIMMASASANSGTPNDRQVLTAKVPMDMSKKNASYTAVGSQLIYWDKMDTSLVISGRATFNVEYSVATSSSYRDGTRFWWSTDGMVQDLTAFGAQTQVNDISTVGSFSVVTKDLQDYKQS
tara:strand:- start:694 stop:4926 length:4233 start_codon:yes stop_codon:yes gene_type:complete